MNMSIASLKKHVGEIRRALGNHKYERDEAGRIHVGSMGIVGAGHYNVRTNGGAWSEDIPNLLPTEGLILMLNLLTNHAAIPALYLCLYATAITPIAGHTGASFPATFGEITSGTEGYTQATRVAYVTVTASGTAVVNNYAAPSTFTIATATSLNVEGVALLTTSTKGDATGKLVSATKFTATRNFVATDQFDVKYQLGMTST